MRGFIGAVRDGIKKLGHCKINLPLFLCTAVSQNICPYISTLKHTSLPVSPLPLGTFDSIGSAIRVMSFDV